MVPAGPPCSGAPKALRAFGYDRVAGPGGLASLCSEVNDTLQPRTERGSTKAAPRCR